MNKKRLIHGFATVYIVAAILVAHSALVTLEATSQNGLDRKAEMGTSAIVVRDSQRLVEPDPREYNRHTDATHADRASRANDADGASGASGADGTDEAAERQATEAERAFPPAPSDDRAIRAQYTIRLWTSTGCTACQRYKRTELPALLKLGYEVEILDYYEDNPPDGIKSLPTTQLVHDGEVIASKGYWTARDIEKFVTKRLKLKE